MPNERIYSVKQLNLLLTLILEHGLIHLDTNGVFAKSGTKASFDELKVFFNQNSQGSVENILLALDAFMTSGPAISDHDWGDLCKYVLKNTRMVEQDNIAGRTSKHILFLEILKEANNFTKSTESITDTLNVDKIHEIFQQFLGQLIKLELIENARAIHNVLRIASLLNEISENGLNLDGISVVLGPAFFSALEIPELYRLGQYNPMKKEQLETKFVSAFMSKLITAHVFKETFDPSLYAEICQPNEKFSEILSQAQGVLDAFFNRVPILSIRPSRASLPLYNLAVATTSSDQKPSGSQSARGSTSSAPNFPPPVFTVAPSPAGLAHSPRTAPSDSISTPSPTERRRMTFGHGALSLPNVFGDKDESKCKKKHHKKK